MGGTDSEDQRIAYYRPNVKATASWYPRCFIHTIVMCCCNAYIIYYLFFNIDRKVYTYLDFLRELIEELAQDEYAKQINPINENNTRPRQYQSKQSWESDHSRFKGMHMCQKINRENVETLRLNNIHT